MAKLKRTLSRDNIQLILTAVTALAVTLSACTSWRMSQLQEQILDIQEELKELQQVMSDYASTIVVQPSSAFLNHTLYNYVNSTLWETMHYGYLKLDLQRITPHLGNFTVRVEEFNVKDSVYINKTDETEVFPIYGGYEGTVGSGLNDITAEIYLRARAYVNAGEITSDDFVFQLGTLTLEVELYDLQARTVAAIKEFDVPIVVIVEKPR